VIPLLKIFRKERKEILNRCENEFWKLGMGERGWRNLDLSLHG
jgi:hypothetical protein